tara:strand:+ start:3526 stop:3810 length:285 start_codon:yes stop_codon:yes gene_type:complete
VPEASGVITGCVFLMVCFVMIPFTYSSYLLDMDQATFPHSELVQLLAALLSISCMLLLGFADEVTTNRRGGAAPAGPAHPHQAGQCPGAGRQGG